jgi:hypothetical protein
MRRADSISVSMSDGTLRWYTLNAASHQGDILLKNIINAEGDEQPEFVIE